MFSELRRAGVFAATGAAVALLWNCAPLLGADFNVTSRIDESSADGGCNADLSSDPANCGACGNACSENQVCSAGMCEAACSTGTTNCDRACVDTRTSALHCGQCQMRCADGASCAGGTCQVCAETPCKVTFPQCGCPVGSGCYPDGSGVLSCQPAGAIDEASVCNVDTDCKPGHLCGNADKSAVRICRRVCAVDADCATPGSICHAQTAAGTKVCTIGCELVTNTRCPATTQCTLSTLPSNMNVRFTDCELAGTRQQNQTCSASMRCAPGHNCANDTAGMICVHYCRAGMPADCPPSTTCDVADANNKIGTTIYGGCFPP